MQNSFPNLSRDHATTKDIYKTNETNNGDSKFKCGFIKKIGKVIS